MASFRGQEIFPMMSGDVPRYTKEVSRKKSANFFQDFNFGRKIQRLLLEKKDYARHYITCQNLTESKYLSHKDHWPESFGKQGIE